MNLYTYRQQSEDTNEHHLKGFKSNSDVVEYYGGVLCANDAPIKYKKELDKEAGVSDRSGDKYNKIVKNKMTGVALLKRADLKRYGAQLTSIRDQFY